MRNYFSSFTRFLFLCVLVCSLFTVTASALTWDGASSSGASGSGNTSGEYEYSFSESSKAVGYRFSVVNASGEVKRAPKSILRLSSEFL